MWNSDPFNRHLLKLPVCVRQCGGYQKYNGNQNMLSSFKQQTLYRAMAEKERGSNREERRKMEAWGRR